MEYERILDPHERAVLANGARLLVCCEVRGELDRTVLTATIRVLARIHPVLAGRFVAVGDDYLVRTGSSDGDGVPTAPLRLAFAEDLDAEASFTPDWTTGPLLRVSLIEDAAGVIVAMSLPRAMIDGTSFIALQHRMWRIYGELLAGKPVFARAIEPVLPLSLDERAHEALTPAGIEEFRCDPAARAAGVVAAMLPTRSTPPDNGGHGFFGSARIEFDTEHTERIVEAAHRAEATVHELVCGVLLTSARRLMSAEAIGPLTLACLSAVDMRPRPAPPIPAEALRSAVSTNTAVVRVDPGADPIEVGRAVAAGLRADLRGDVPARGVVDTPTPTPYVLERGTAIPPTLVVINLRNITPPALPPGLALVDWFAVPVIDSPLPMAVVARFDGRLRIHLCFSRTWYDDALMQRLISTSAALFDRIGG
ncbi:phthiocerol/phthiodiolone dimycocerosyl transferase family protein [Embleya sp. AB8]|uniref:phthiocerol/phthiodiolone dimycocerosyl transferase family protein n=1 Tax=Embleya sp. AB8 TaxID=3156304 RepID=UPI003C7141B1